MRILPRRLVVTSLIVPNMHNSIGPSRDSLADFTFHGGISEKVSKHTPLDLYPNGCILLAFAILCSLQARDNHLTCKNTQIIFSQFVNMAPCNMPPLT